MRSNMFSACFSTAISILVFFSSLQSAHAATIAIVDTGLRSSILGDVITTTGNFDFRNNDTDATDDTPNLHGTATGHVAINSGSGITLTAIKIFGSDFSTTSDISSAAFSHIATLDNVRVVSHSGASLVDTPLESLQAVGNSGKIIVFQAGNFAGDSPHRDAGMAGAVANSIVAGGLNPDGSFAIFSNRPGALLDIYMVAQTNSLLTSSNGTSMSTPRIAAAAATVFDRFGFLTAGQVREILFLTADDLGAPGTDDVFGRGGVNLGAALAAAGAGDIPTTPDSAGNSSGGGSGLGIAALGIGAVVAYALLNKKEDLQSTVMVDSFGRAFTFGLGDRITVRDSKPTIHSLFENQRADFATTILSESGNSFTRAIVVNQTMNQYHYTAGGELKEKSISFLHRTKNPDSYYTMGLNSDLSSDFGALSYVKKDQLSPEPQFALNSLFSTPVLGYSSQGSSFMYGWDKKNLNHRFGFSVIDEQKDNGQVSNSVLYESAVNKDAYHVGFQLGALLENGSLLGGSSDSAFGVDNTETYYLGLNGSFNVTNNVSLLGGYFQGMSSIDESKNSLISDFSTIKTEGYALGLLVDNLFSDKGNFGISYSSPLQTTDGSATLTLPVSQNRNTGAIGFESSSLSFNDGDKEKIIEAYYNYKLGGKNNVFAHISYAKNPVSNLDVSRDRTFYVGWKRQF